MYMYVNMGKPLGTEVCWFVDGTLTVHDASQSWGHADMLPAGFINSTSTFDCRHKLTV